MQPESLLTPCGYDEPGSLLEVPESPVRGIGILNYLQICAVIKISQLDKNITVFLPNRAFTPETAKRMATCLQTLAPDFPKERLIVEPTVQETRGEIKIARWKAIAKRIKVADMIAIDYHFPRVNRNVQRLHRGLKMTTYRMEDMFRPDVLSTEQAEILRVWKKSELQKRLRAREAIPNAIDKYLPLVGPMIIEILGRNTGSNRPEHDIYLKISSKLTQE